VMRSAPPLPSAHGETMKWSALGGVLWVLGTGVGTAYLTRQNTSRHPPIYWLLGIAALLPPGMIAFAGLLGSVTGPRPEKILTAAWILSSSAALLGVIVTDALLKRFGESGRGHRPLTSWLRGIVALLPGWAIAFLVLMLKTTGR